MSEQVVTFHPQKPKERIRRVREVQDVIFSELKVLNVILTNACNLSCSYCFEQHKKDYGKFDLDKLHQLYEFFAQCNHMENKVFQFFGGEPLAQKKLILEFCNTYKDILSANKDHTRVSIVTNALLLTPEFIEEYCSYDFTSLVISLDTDDAESNRRELTQANIDYIFEMIALLPAHMTQDSHHVAIRCTINEESVPHLERFIFRLYQAGIRNFVIHPLIMGREQGVIEWDETIWQDMYKTLRWAMTAYPDFKITWAEGVGVKGESNCMVGSDMIAMDASGDFSGCYFLTNLKEQFSSTMLGNFFRDEIYVDRYIQFQQAYTDMLKHEECQTCDLKNFCYQCPAGNFATGGQLFRPDGMCKRIVGLFLMIRQDINKKAVLKKLADIEKAVAEEGDIVLSRAVIHLMFNQFLHLRVNNEALALHKTLPHNRVIQGEFIRALKNPNYAMPMLDVFVENLNGCQEDTATAYQLYCALCEHKGVPMPEYEPTGTQAEENYFITLCHLLVLDNSTYLNKFDPEHSRSQILDL